MDTLVKLAAVANAIAIAYNALTDRLEVVPVVAGRRGPTGT